MKQEFLYQIQLLTQFLRYDVDRAKMKGLSQMYFLIGACAINIASIWSDGITAKSFIQVPFTKWKTASACSFPVEFGIGDTPNNISFLLLINIIANPSTFSLPVKEGCNIPVHNCSTQGGLSLYNCSLLCRMVNLLTLKFWTLWPKVSADAINILAADFTDFTFI